MCIRDSYRSGGYGKDFCRCACAECQGTLSVSYTHLDVYKRQQQYRWQAAAKANQTNSLPADMTDMDQFVTYQFVPVSDCDLTAAVMQLSLIHILNLFFSEFQSM